jgi:hypothetical protein
VGAVRHQPVLQAAGVLVGTVIGVLLCWWGGHLAARRLADRGAELMDLLRLGPQARSRRDQAGPVRRPAVSMPAWKSAARGLLFTVGMVLVVPQGLVPIAFNLFGVDPEVKVWFAARYLPQDLQSPVAVGFIAVGALAIWWAVSITRRHAEQH